VVGSAWHCTKIEKSALKSPFSLCEDELQTGHDENRSQRSAYTVALQPASTQLRPEQHPARSHHSPHLQCVRKVLNPCPVARLRCYRVGEDERRRRTSRWLGLAQPVNKGNRLGKFPPPVSGTQLSEIQDTPGLWTGTLLSVIVSSVEAGAKGVKGG